ncbi:MAG: ABC transporter ATP-binding protein [Myxococcaceae bacterium]
MIEIEDVHKAFGGQKVLRGVTLTVAEGTTCVLLGVSGSGKTVLMKIVIGLLRPDRGRVRIDGEEVGRLDPEGLRRLRDKLGILFQSGALFDSLTVFENVAFPLVEHRRRPAEIRALVRRALDLMDLGNIEGLYPAELSGGMRKRVAFARAIVLEPRIVLYDEPTAGLDPPTTQRVADLIIAAKQRLNLTALATIYDLPTAFRVADRLAMLHGGRIVEEGTPDELRRSPHPAVQAFLRRWLELSQGHAPSPGG